MSHNGISWAETEAGKQLQERLTNEKTLNVLNHLLDRIDTLENAVERLATTLEQAPGFVSMAADMVDEGYRKAAERGVDVEKRLGAALEIAEKLTAPQMIDNLNQLFVLAEQAPGLTSMVADMVDEGYRKAAENGIDVEQRLGAALEIAEKLTAPSMVANLNQLLVLAEQAPGLSSMVADMVDEGYRKAAERGVNIEQRIGLALEAAEKLTAPKMIDNLNQLLTLSEQAPGLIAMGMDTLDETYRRTAEEGIDLQAIGVFAGNAGKAVSKAINQPTEKMGIFGLMRALNDPDRQKALGFLMNLTKELGKTM